MCIKNIVSNEYQMNLFQNLIYMTFLSKHFVFRHGHMDLVRCQNIGKEIIWGHDYMIGCTLLFIL